MNPADWNMGPFAPLSPLVLIVGALTIRLWGRHTAETSGRPVAVLAATCSVLAACGVFAWQLSVEGSQTLIGPTWMTVPGRVPTSIDFSFHVDRLSLFWLVLVAGLSAFTIILDRRIANRGELTWRLLAPAGAQFALLADNLVILLAFWEFSQIASAQLQKSNHPVDDRACGRLPLPALAADLPLLIGVVVCWQNFGSFQLSLLTAPETLIGLAPNQLAAMELLGYCVLGAAYARCFQFPFCTPAFHSVDSSNESVKTLLCVIIPTGLYLLLRFYPWFSVEPGARSLLVGGGCLSALLWGAMSLTQPTLARSAVSFAAGSIGLVFVGIGHSGVPPLLLCGSLVTGSWAVLQLAGAPPVRRSAWRSAAAIAVVMSCGAFGQEAVLNAAWNPGETSEESRIGPVTPAVIMLADLLLCAGLFRGLFRHSCLREVPIDVASASGVVAEERTDSATLPAGAAEAPSPLVSVVVTIIGLAAAPVLAVSAEWGGPLPISMPVVTGVLMILALLLAWVLYAGASDWPRRIENATGGLATLSRRSFYVEELIQLTWVMPWTVLSWVASSSDRTFLRRKSQQLQEIRIGTRRTLLAALSENPLPAYIIALAMGAAAVISLLIQE